MTYSVDDGVNDPEFSFHRFASGFSENNPPHNIKIFGVTEINYLHLAIKNAVFFIQYISIVKAEKKNLNKSIDKKKCNYEGSYSF